MSERISPPGYMTFDEAAKELGLSRHTLRSHYKGMGLVIDCLVPVRRGRMALFKEEEVLRVKAERGAV